MIRNERPSMRKLLFGLRRVYWRVTGRVYIRPGMAIGHKQHPARRGTVGCFVKHESQWALLTCDHVVSGATAASPVHLHKQTKNGVTHCHELGGVRVSGEFRRTGMDAAVVGLPEHIRIDRDIPRIGAIEPTIADEMPTQVQKFGFETEHSRGIVLGLFERRIEIDGVRLPKARLYFVRYLPSKAPRKQKRRTGVFSELGDSGSVVWEEVPTLGGIVPSVLRAVGIWPTRRPRGVGLLVSCTLSGDAYVLPLRAVFSTLGIKFVDNS